MSLRFICMSQQLKILWVVTNDVLLFQNIVISHKDLSVIAHSSRIDIKVFWSFSEKVKKNIYIKLVSKFMFRQRYIVFYYSQLLKSSKTIE
jgi:hypothetical protein